MTKAKAEATRAVIFDMDGVLVDSEWFIAEAARLMFRELYDVAVTHADFTPFIGQGEDRFTSGVAEIYGVNGFDVVEAKARTYAIYEEIAFGRLKELPGVTAYIRTCRAAGLKTALATSADRVKMVVNLKQLGLDLSQFDATVNGSEIARKKPFPDIFLETARRLGLAPSACWVVEDAISGVQAAKAAGMRCLGLTTNFGPARLKSAGADAVAANLADAAARGLGPLSP